MDQEQPSKYEQKKLRREEKEKQRMRGRAKRRWGTWLMLLLGTAVIATGIFFLINNKGKRDNVPDLSRAMPDEGSIHVPEGTDVTYQSNPPTSGNHWPIPLFPKLYDVEKPDEAIIHSLEHGRVWISYKPSIPEETKQGLTKLLRGRSGVILTPRLANDTDIAMAAWGRLDTFNLFADGELSRDRILNFVNRYLNKGPEYVPTMDGKEY
ncbi:MAG: DUF3105 domain-containing protein [Parcubacteria group bacterium]|nr:DUF3105 domain-containing protein [Parcubacteria group bacterium]